MICHTVARSAGNYMQTGTCVCSMAVSVETTSSSTYRGRKQKRPEEVAQELKKELSRFGIESIRIIAPGQYEINLERLLEREEIIIALEEEGRYIIHLPSLLKKKPKE